MQTLKPVVAFLVLSGCAGSGYLSPGEIDIRSAVPSAPDKEKANADRRIFLGTRHFIVENEERGKLAKRDVRQSPAALMHDFSCSVGVVLTPKNARHLARLMRRAGADASGQADKLKDSFRRLRPFLIDRGRICQSKFFLRHTYDYPSGHTTKGWTWATLLAEMVPSRAPQILERGRAYGESRIVCGAHNASAVDAGKLTALATLDVVRTSRSYQADFAAAKSEVLGLIANSTTPRPDQHECEVEAGLISQPIFPTYPVNGKVGDTKYELLSIRR